MQMRSSVFVAALMSILCCSSAVRSQQQRTLHVISVADTDRVEDVGPGAAANAKALSDYVKDVARVTGMTLDPVSVDGRNFSCAAIDKAVAGLRPKEPDVVIFYFSGHGVAPTNSQVASTSIFPWLECDWNGPFKNLKTFNQQLLGKGARLTITVADTCNAPVNADVTLEPFEAQGLHDDQMKAMFLHFEGSLVMSSSKQGSLSKYMGNGGLFTKKFIGNLKSTSLVAEKDLWSDVIRRTKERIVWRDYDQREPPGGFQEAQDEYNLRYSPNF
jgi:hypothetical protein